MKNKDKMKTENATAQLETKVRKLWSKKKKIIVISSAVGIALVLLAVVAVVIVYHYIGKVNIVENSGVDVNSVISDYADNLTGDSLDRSDIINKIEDDLADDKTDGEDTDSDTVGGVNQQNLDNYNRMSQDIMDSPDVTNILLIGTDSREGSDRGRSDSMILLSVNEVTQRVTMFSFLRDIYIYIPGVGSTRLNHSYAYGGPELTMQTISENFGIRIDKYVQVDFYSFIQTVDAAGGVDIYVTDDEAALINQYLDEINDLLGSPLGTDSVAGGGDLHLNGKQALCYARIRYIGTDFARTSRQREVLNQVIEKTRGMSMSELDSFLNITLPLVTTNLTQSELFSILLNASAYIDYERISDSIPLDGTYSFMTVRGMSVIGMDFDANISVLRSEIYGD